MNILETSANIARADNARRLLVEDLGRMSNVTEAVVYAGVRDFRRAVPALLGIAALAVVAAGAAALISRAGKRNRNRWLAPKRPSFLREVTRTVALNLIGALASRLAQRVPLALMAAHSEQHGYAG
jgi:hypothetical protein